jgi:hypothetical protein
MEVEFDECADDSWICTSFSIDALLEPIQLTLISESRPDAAYIDTVVKTLGSVQQLTLQAAHLILENYSYEHFKNLGINDSLLLKDKTPEGMQKVAKLNSVCFFDEDCEDFELSFSVPWDEEHSFDVEFNGREAISCAVNG